MNSLDLIHLQITLEYQLSPAGQLIPFPGSTEQARYVAYRRTGGFVRYFRADLPPEVQAAVGALSPDAIFTAPEVLWRSLGESGPCPAWETFESLYFARTPSPDEFPDVSESNETFVIVADGQEAACAWSERQNERCAELAVETLPAFRRRGYARQVAAAWADHVIRTGRVAFYSHKTSNEASRLLAASLGVVWYATCACVD